MELNMLGIGAWELTIIFAIVLVLFGAKRLPNVATGLGQAIRNFSGALKGEIEMEPKKSLKPGENAAEEKHI